MALLDKFLQLKVSTEGKLNFLHSRINQIAPWIGLSPNAGQSLTTDTEGKLYFKERTPEEIAADYEGIVGVNRFTDSYKQTVDGLSGSLSGKADLDPDTNKLRIDQVPQFSITNKIAATESTLDAFILNVNTYTFDEGDVIVIDNAGTLEHYLYDGGDRSLSASYSPVTPTSIGWANITGKPDLVKSVNGILPDANGNVTIEVGGNPVDGTYIDITALIADQNNQQEDFIYEVLDASADSKVGTGKAYYFYDGTIAGTIEDYTLLTKEEVTQLTSQQVNSALGYTPLDTRASNLASDLSEVEKGEIRGKIGVVEDQIVNGVTDKAPSQNIVFDALTTKADKDLSNLSEVEAEAARVNINAASDSEVVKSVNGNSPDNEGNVSIDTNNSRIPHTDEFFFSAGDTQTKTLSFNPVNGLVRVYVNGNRIYSTQYNLMNEKQVEILDTLTDGDPIAVDYYKLASDLITLLLLTPQEGIEQWNADRNSTATYVDVNGVIQIAQPNEARIDYSTGGARVLVERQSTNTIEYSEAMSLIGVGASGGGIVFESFNWPIGLQNSVFFEDNAIARYFYQGDMGGVSGTYTVSFFVEMLDGSSPKVGITSNEDLSLRVGGLTAHNNITIKQITGNIYRVSGSATSTSFPATNGGIFKRTTNSAKSFRVTGIQLESGEGTSYIPTNGTTVTRLADFITIAPPTETTQITETIDGTVSTVLSIPATYQIPQGNVYKIEMK